MTDVAAFVPPRRVYIGVDPGSKTGLAVVMGRKFELLETTDFWGAYRTILDNYPPRLVARIDVEVAATTNTWHLNGKKMTYEKAAKIGQDVGGVRREGELLVSGLAALGYKVFAQEPLGAGKDKRVFRQITGLDGRKYSEHARDAAVMAYTRANGA